MTAELPSAFDWFLLFAVCASFTIAQIQIYRIRLAQHTTYRVLATQDEEMRLLMRTPQCQVRN